MKVQNGYTLVAVCLLAYSQSALSLGLGDARVQSFIGQPLEMRIDLLAAPTDDLGSVTARLATADDFALIGASREAISVPLSFSVREGDGASGSYILVTSRLALNDPVLRLVVEVTWSSGRLLREYTVFLDPPTVPARAPEPVTARPDSGPPPSAAPQPESDASAGAAATPPPPAVATDDGDDVAESTVQPPVSEPIAEGAEYGPVRSGETLWRITSNYMGESNMDRNQVMLAIQRKNPNAFVNDNINLLMRGATLEMPSAEEVNEVSRERARELVAQQEAAFRMRGSLASTSTPLLAAESRVSAAESGAGEDISGADDEAVSRLEIVPTSEEDLSAGQPGTGAVPGGEGAEEVTRDLREELARTEEELISERQQNDYLRERINELEAQLAESDGASDGLVADDELANLEDRLQSERLAEAQGAEEEPAPAEAENGSPGAMPSVTTAAPAGEDRPWYSGPVIWVIMAVIVVAAVVGWVINRRRGEEMYVADLGDSGTAVAGLKGDAEEILRALDTEREEVAEEEPLGQPEGYETGAADEREEEDDEGRPVVRLERARRQREGESVDARVLDESSSDPEIKLDLARAYISMGDKEAARVILDEVLNSGSEAQRSEARSMMDEL